MRRQSVNVSLPFAGKCPNLRCELLYIVVVAFRNRFKRLDAVMQNQRILRELRDGFGVFRNGDGVCRSQCRQFFGGQVGFLAG